MKFPILIKNSLITNICFWEIKDLWTGINGTPLLPLVDMIIPILVTLIKKNAKKLFQKLNSCMMVLTCKILCKIVKIIKKLVVSIPLTLVTITLLLKNFSIKKKLKRLYMSILISKELIKFVPKLIMKPLMLLCTHMKS